MIKILIVFGTKPEAIKMGSKVYVTAQYKETISYKKKGFNCEI